MIVPAERRGQTLGEVVGGHRAEAPPGVTPGGQLQGNIDEKFETCIVVTELKVVEKYNSHL